MQQAKTQINIKKKDESKGHGQKPAIIARGAPQLI